MTVTPIERSGVQNPAYRPVAPLSSKNSTMKLGGMAGTLGTALIMACVSAPPAAPPAPANAPVVRPTPPLPTPTPVAPIPRALESHATSWNFAYTPGTYTYVFKTNATIAPVTDTMLKQPVPELNQRATIVISDSGSVQVVDPISGPPATCDANTAVTVRALQLIPKITNHLTIGDKWRDSTTTTGCRGAIPAESTTISNYIVVGETMLQNIPVLQIQRSDSLSANGEGVDGQHRILITATGTGATDLFLDIPTGRLLSVSGAQTTLVNVTTSGRLVSFVQHVTESISIAGFR